MVVVAYSIYIQKYIYRSYFFPMEIATRQNHTCSGRQQEEMDFPIWYEVSTARDRLHAISCMFQLSRNKMKALINSFIIGQVNYSVDIWRNFYTSPIQHTLSNVSAIWERGYTEADQVFYWLAQGKAQLTIMKNGAPNSQKTTYSVFPAKWQNSSSPNKHDRQNCIWALLLWG